MYVTNWVLKELTTVIKHSIRKLHYDRVSDYKADVRQDSFR